VKFRRPKREWRDIKSKFLWRLVFPVMSRKIARTVFSSVCVALDWKLNVVGKNYAQEREAVA